MGLGAGAGVALGHVAQQAASPSQPPQIAYNGAAIGAQPEAPVGVVEGTQQDPEQVSGLFSGIGSGLISGLSAAANVLDLPGSSVRDVLTLNNPFDQWLTPTTHQNRVTGREMLTKWGLTPKNRPTGITGWADHPSEAIYDTAGLAAEIFFDPFFPHFMRPLMGKNVANKFTQQAIKYPFTGAGPRQAYRAAGQAAETAANAVPGGARAVSGVKQTAAFAGDMADRSWRYGKQHFDASVMGRYYRETQAAMKGVSAANKKATQDTLGETIPLYNQLEKQSSTLGSTLKNQDIERAIEAGAFSRHPGALEAAFEAKVKREGLTFGDAAQGLDGSKEEAFREFKESIEGISAKTTASGAPKDLYPDRTRVHETLKQTFGNEQGAATSAVMDAHATLWGAANKRHASEWYKEMVDVAKKEDGMFFLRDARGEFGPDTMWQLGKEAEGWGPAFYSKVVSINADGKFTGKMGLDAMKNALLKHGVTKEEIADINLDDLFRKFADKEGKHAGKLDADIVAEAANNRAVDDLEDVILTPRTRDSLDDISELRQSGEDAAADAIARSFSQYDEYVPPGGVRGSYRELLIRSKGSNYGSGHFSDFDGIQAHVRLDDIQLPDGSKALRINEIQSDLHQAGRKEGYRTPNAAPQENFANWSAREHGLSAEEAQALFNTDSKIFREYREVQDELISNPMRRSPADSPFKESWHKLALKRVLRHAAENGYDRVVLADGRDIANAVGGPRYALRKWHSRLNDTLAKDFKKYGEVGEQVPYLARHGDEHFAEFASNTGKTPTTNDVIDALQEHRRRFDELGQPNADRQRFVSQSGALMDLVHLMESSSMSFDDAFYQLKESYGYSAARLEALAGELGGTVKYVQEPKSLSGVAYKVPQQMKDDLLHKGQPLYQKPPGDTGGPRGAVTWAEDGRATIHAFQSADASTAIHETAHIFRRSLESVGEGELLERAADALGVTNGNWTRAHEEAFATGFERYARDGFAPTPELKTVFEKFKGWLKQVYRNIRGTPLEDQVNPQLKEVFDEMLGGKLPSEVRKSAFSVPEYEKLAGVIRDIPDEFYTDQAWKNINRRFRDIMENTPAAKHLDPATDATTHAAYQMVDAAKRIQTLAKNLGAGDKYTIDDLIGFGARKAGDHVVHPYKEIDKATGQLLGTRNPNMARDDLFKGFKGGTNAVEDFVRDPELGAMADAAAGLSKEEAQEFITDAMVPYIANKYGNKINDALPLRDPETGRLLYKDVASGKVQAYTTEQLKKHGRELPNGNLEYTRTSNFGKTKTTFELKQEVRSRHEGLADYLVKHPEVRSKGLYTNNPLKDMNDYLLANSRRLNAISGAWDILGKSPGIYTGAVRAGKKARGDTSTTIGDLISLTGFDKNLATKAIAERMGVKLPAGGKELSKELIKIRSKIIRPEIADEITMSWPGKVPEPGGLGKAIDSFTALFKAGVLTHPGRYTRDISTGTIRNWENGWISNLSDLSDTHAILQGRNVSGYKDLTAVKQWVLKNRTKQSWSPATKAAHEQYQRALEIGRGVQHAEDATPELLDQARNAIRESRAAFEKSRTTTSGPVNRVVTDEEATQAIREMYAAWKASTDTIMSDTGAAVREGGEATGLEQFVAAQPGAKNVAKPKTVLQSARETFDIARGKTPGYNLDPRNIRGISDMQGNVRPETTFGPVAAGDIAGRYSDDVVRMSPLLNQLKSGKSFDEAQDVFNQINKAQVDYSHTAFTPTERQIKRYLPFYSFSSRQFPYVANELMKNPGGRLAQMIRSTNHMKGDSDTPRPEYIDQTTSFPIGTLPDGSQRYFTGANLMHEDPLAFFGGGLRGAGIELLSRANPLIKGPLEWFTGESFFQRGPLGGRDIEDLDPTIGRTIQNVKDIATGETSYDAKPFISPGFEAVAANSPLSRVLSNARTITDKRKYTGPLGFVAPAANLLTGFRFTDISPRAQDAVVRDTARSIAKSELGAKAFERYYIPKERLEAAKQENQQLYERMESFNQLQRLLANRAKAAKLAREKEALAGQNQ